MDGSRRGGGIAAPRFRWRRALAPLLAGFALAGCGGGPTDGTLARWKSGKVTVDELDELVRGLPAARRQPADEQPLDEWVEARLRDLAVSEIVNRRAEVEDAAAGPALALRARYEASVEVGRAYLGERCVPGEIEDVDLQRWFDRAYPEGQEWILLRHVYKRTAPGAPAPRRAAVRAELERLRSELDAGASFVEIARAHSDSETAEDGGLIGRISREAPIEPRVRAVAWTLADGEVSGVVEVDNGFHLLLRERSGVTERPDFEQARAELRQAESLRRREACGREILARLGDETPITIDRGALLDPEDASRVALTIGHETFSAEQLAGLTNDLSPLALNPRPGELLRQFSEAVVLTRAAIAEDDGARTRLEAGEARALRRLSNEALWRRERRRAVEARPEEAIRAYFDDNAARFQTDLELDVGLILVGSQGSAGRRPAMERTLALRRRLEAGEPFEALAAEASEHDSREQGGRLGSMPLPRLRVVLGSRGIEKVALLAPGEVSEPIQVHDPPAASFALVHLYGRTAPRPRPFEEVREEVLVALSEDNVRRLDLEVRDRLLSEADFELDNAAIAGYVERVRGPA